MIGKPIYFIDVHGEPGRTHNHITFLGPGRHVLYIMLEYDKSRNIENCFQNLR